jgi:hypothetical protein
MMVLNKAVEVGFEQAIIRVSRQQIDHLFGGKGSSSSNISYFIHHLSTSVSNTYHGHERTAFELPLGEVVDTHLG